MAPSTSILASAELKDEFPDGFCVYDLNEFISVYDMFKEGEMLFDDKHVIFKDGNRRTKYRKTAKEMIVLPKADSLKLQTVDLEFFLPQKDYIKLMEASSKLGTPNIRIVSDGETVQFENYDLAGKNPNSNLIEICPGNGNKYSVVFKTENFKMILGDYNVRVAFKGIAHFKNAAQEIEYWVAAEPQTKIGG
jgi:hypothetical protein